MTGLHQSGFASALGEAYRLEHANGWVLKRQIRDDGLFDLRSPYPNFAETDFTKINLDLKSLIKEKKAVALTIRSDSLSESNVLTTKANWDWFKEFKTHYITDLSGDWRSSAARNALRYEKRARQTFEYEVTTTPLAFAKDLHDLNRIILQRTQGPTQSQLNIETLKQQIGLAGAVLIKASNGSGLQALGLFMQSKNRAYAYLLGSTNEARDDYVIYGLYGFALDLFSNRVTYVDFGGAPGMYDNFDHPVAKFKRLWTNKMAKSYICGKIIRKDIYGQLTDDAPIEHADYFPGYRI